jgi:hypothetical protein
MLPFAVLGVFLVDSGSFNWSAISIFWSQLNEFTVSFASSMILVVILETVLRIIDTLSQIFFPPPPSIEPLE